MKLFLRRLYALFFVLLLTLAVPVCFPTAPSAIQAQAATQKTTQQLTPSRVFLIKGQSLRIVTGSSARTSWSSSQKTVVRVSSAGTVTALKKGTAVVTAKIGKKKLNYRITVQTPSISAKTASMTAGTSKTLKLNGTDQKISWKSSKPTVATVTQKGKVTAKKAGTATITATVLGKSYSCKITVKKKTSSSGSASQTPSVSQSGSSGSDSSMVWISRTGTKYHRTSSCSNMKNPSYISLSEALASGREACQKCY